MRIYHIDGLLLLEVPGNTLAGVDLRNANLQGANLHGADLRCADLQYADLQGADLQGAYLQSANLQDVDLHGANLRNANLHGANLRFANLHDANLQGADLRNADLHGANLHDANLRGTAPVPAAPVPAAPVPAAPVPADPAPTAPVPAPFCGWMGRCERPPIPGLTYKHRDYPGATHHSCLQHVKTHRDFHWAVASGTAPKVTRCAACSMWAEAGVRQWVNSDGDTMDACERHWCEKHKCGLRCSKQGGTFCDCCTLCHKPPAHEGGSADGGSAVCDCRTCRNCGRRKPHSETPCVICGNCTDCCSCWTCVGCAVRRSGATQARERCHNCNRCQGCCQCLHCEYCGVRRAAAGICTRCVRCVGSCCQCSRHSGITLADPAPKPTFWPGKLYQDKGKRFTAVEIEVAESALAKADAVNRALARWKACAVRDGSLPASGYEINTAPASGSAFDKQVAEICAALKEAGARITSKCGLHVHLDCRDVTYFDFRRVLYVYSRVEDQLFSMLDSSRQDNHYCLRMDPGMRKVVQGAPDKTWKRKLIQAQYKVETRTRDGLRNIQTVKEHKYHGSRYYALNFHSWFHRGTLEFRHHQGTVAEAEIKNWVGICSSVVDFALTHSESWLKDPAAWDGKLDKILPAGLREYYRARVNCFNHVERED